MNFSEKVASYQENHNDSHLDLSEAKEKEHQEFHVAEYIFDEGCEWCKVEKCNQCRGWGMNENGKLICGRCYGRGRIL